MLGVYRVWRDSLWQVFAYRPAFMVMVLSLVIYGVLYPQPYLAETLRDIPVALVDQDNSVSSRELARRLAATETVQVAGFFTDMVAAERALFAREVYGIVYIPQAFERELLRGGASTLALYADASYFLMYQQLSTGVNTVARGLGAEVDMGRLLAQGVAPAQALAQVDPLPLVMVPLFNPQGGYASYLLPAAFVLILQQTLMMGVGLLATRREQLGLLPAMPVGAFLQTLLGQSLAYVSLYALLVPLFLLVVPGWYGLPALGSVGMVLWVALPFVLAAVFLGLLVAAWLKKGELVQLVLLGIGLPFFFLSGFAWPSDAMPTWIVVLAQWVPSTPAIDGLVRVTQMGAGMADVAWQVLHLWALVVFYGMLLGFGSLRKRRCP